MNEKTAAQGPTDGPWVVYHDKELGQWQVLDADETTVLATGIEKESDARLMAGAWRVNG